MNGWIEWFNATSTVWAERFWMATWQAIIVIAIAWLLTTLLRRLSPRVRSWIWRLAYVKILLSLFWTTPIEVALLPAVATTENQPASRERQRPEQSGDRGQEAGVGSQESRVRDQGSEVMDSLRDEASAPEEEKLATSSVQSAEPTSVLPTDESSRQQAESSKEASTPLSWQSYLIGIWLLGLFAVIAWLAADAWRAAQVLRRSKPLTDERWRALSETVCRQLGLRHAIRLRSSATARSPVLIRFIRPAIILPQAMLDSFSPSPLTAAHQQIPPSPLTGEGRGEGESISQNHIALAVAHEAAHLRRHDLAWNALAAIVHVAMYFHPLVWLAHRRIRLEQEMACDELVLQKLSAAPQDYGRMLVNVVRNIAPGVVITLK